MHRPEQVDRFLGSVAEWINSWLTWDYSVPHPAGGHPAGTPAHTSLAGTFLVTTAPMPTSASSPTTSPWPTTVPAPI